MVNTSDNKNKILLKQTVMKTLKTMGEILSMEKGQLKSWIDDVNASKESTIIVYIGSTKLSREVSVSIQNQFAKSRKQAYAMYMSYLAYLQNRANLLSASPLLVIKEAKMIVDKNGISTVYFHVCPTLNPWASFAVREDQLLKSKGVTSM